MSINRLVGKEFVVARGEEDGHNVHKDGRDTSPQIQQCASRPPNNIVEVVPTRGSKE